MPAYSTKIIFDDTEFSQLRDILSQFNKNQIFILTDQNVEKLVLPKLHLLQEYPKFTIAPGEKSKNIDTATQIWDFLTTNKANRDALLINLGGGVITDLGGFVASTYKRGIQFINIPTTLLAQVDASIGGKTGVDFEHYKNLIGTFSSPLAVIINTSLLSTLTQRQFIAGYAEMIKHALLAGETDWQLIKSFNLQQIDYQLLQVLVEKSINFKLQVVEKDPYEKDYRKVLNFGHTIGHAIETFFLQKNIEILHGEAVAIGIITETYLSNQKFILDFNKVFEITGYIIKIFPKPRIAYEDYEQLYKIMLHDKKNKDGQIHFTLLRAIGQPEINQTCTKNSIFEALNFYRQMTTR